MSYRESLYPLYGIQCLSNSGLKTYISLHAVFPPDAYVNLDQDAYSVHESDGNVSVCAVLLGGVLGREVAVNITTIDNVGTATGMSQTRVPFSGFTLSIY